MTHGARPRDRSTLFSRQNRSVTAADLPNQEPTAVVRLRYRPAADVLVGEVSWPAPAVGMITDEPDADTRRVWSRTAAGHQRLEEFLIIRAAERLAAGESVLPDALNEVLVDLLTSGLLELEGAKSSTDRMRVQGEATVQVCGWFADEFYAEVQSIRDQAEAAEGDD